MQTLIHEGGLVPKSLYKSSPDCEPDAVPEEHLNVNQDIYKAVEVKQGEYFEVVLKNNDLKSVLTWDFDVLNVDVKFTVLRTMGTLQEGQSRQDRRLSILQENKLNEEGVDFVKEEPTLTCRPKESVQVNQSRIYNNCRFHCSSLFDCFRAPM